MAKTICVREGKIVENKEIVYFKHFWEHILYKQMLELNKDISEKFRWQQIYMMSLE